MDGPDRRHPGDVDATLQRAVAVWAGPMARVVAIALLSVAPALDGVGDRRYRIMTRVGLDDPREWTVMTRWRSSEVVAGLTSEERPQSERPVSGDTDASSMGWVAFLESGDVR